MYRFEKLTVITSLLFIILIILPIEFNQITFVALIPAFAAVGTIYFGFIKYWIDEDIMFKALFEGLNKRFDDINIHLNLIITGELTDKTKVNDTIQNYLNLCAEEYYWFYRRRIPKHVWNSWQAGMFYYIEKSALIKSYFNEQADYDKSYYGFFEYIKPFNKL